VKAGEVAVWGLVVSGGDPSPGLELVNQALDGVPLLVEDDIVVRHSPRICSRSIDA
jgi:hypothetical protein